MGPNNSFKPNLLRYTKHMAEKACHVFGSATQVGLTQALGLMVDSNSRSQQEALDSILASYGRFCITFELAVFRLRSLIERTLKAGGLANQGVAQVLLANQTAEPLRALLHPLLEQVRPLTKREVVTLSHISNRFQRLTEQRNIVVHSTWFLMAIGQDDVDYEKLDGFKYIRKKGSSSLDVLQTDVKRLNELTQEAETLADSFLAIGHALDFGDPIDSKFKRDATDRYLPAFKKYWPET